MLYSLMNMFRDQKRWPRAFTYMEIMVVIIIIGVMAAVAIPSLHYHTLRMQNEEATQILMSLWEGQKSYYMENGTYFDTGFLPWPGRLNDIDNALAVTVPEPKYFWDIKTYSSGSVCASSPGDPEVVSIMTRGTSPLYVLLVTEQGKIFCICPTPNACSKMGLTPCS